MPIDRISEAEYAVMEALWDASPLTANDIAGIVSAERDWTLQTVKTLLSRLANKGAVTHRRDGRHFLYSPVLAREDYVRDESDRLVTRLFGGRAGPLFAHLAERDAFTDQDIADIEKLLKEMKS